MTNEVKLKLKKNKKNTTLMISDDDVSQSVTFDNDLSMELVALSIGHMMNSISKNKSHKIEV